MQVFMDYVGVLNWWAVITATLAAFATGAVWYAQSIFGKKWQKAVGLSNKQIKDTNMSEVTITSLATILVSAVAVGLLVRVLVLDTFIQGALLGIMLAVGVLGANKLMQVKFERRPMNYWFITLGADIVAFAVMGGILAFWQ